MAFEFFKKRSQPATPVPFARHVIATPEELRREYVRSLQFQLEILEEEMVELGNKWDKGVAKVAELRAAIAAHQE